MLVSVFVAGVNAHGAMTDPPARNVLGWPQFRTKNKYDKCFFPEGLGQDGNMTEDKWDKQEWANAEHEWNGLGREGSLTREVRARGRKDNNDMDPHEIGPPCGNGELGAGTMKKYGDLKTYKYGVTKAYKPGSTITLSFHMTKQHGGHTWADYACVDNHLDQLPTDKSVKWTRLKVASGGTTVMWKQVTNKDTFDKYDVVLPNEKCNHGVIQWTFFGEQSWDGPGDDGKIESFFNCADIRITDDAESFKATCPDGTPPAGGGGSNTGGSDGNSNTEGSDGNTGGSDGNTEGSDGNNNQGGGNIPTTTNSGDDSTTTILLIVGGILVLLVVAVTVVVIRRKKARRDADAQKANRAKNNAQRGYKNPRYPPRPRR